MKPTIAIAMSGGIDSLVSAFILKEKGFPVFGIHFLTGFEPAPSDHIPDPLNTIARQLDIPIHRVDLSHVFRSKVVNYFVRTYREGKTPNPCLICNPLIKFGELLNAAGKWGADLLATGHYARVAQTADGRFELFKGADHRKDQSYFLAFLSQYQLSKASFPLEQMTKTEVRALAKEKGLAPVQKNESQDVCFIHGKSYSDFLREQDGIEPSAGPITDLEGNVVGRHDGLHRFTVGQRRGIDCPSTEPYYVIRLEPSCNTLVVGRKNDLDADRCAVAQVNWIIPAPSSPMPISVRLRYRHEAVPAQLLPQGSGRALINFDAKQQAPTPGQGAVFYSGAKVLGGGVITE